MKRIRFEIGGKIYEGVLIVLMFYRLDKNIEQIRKDNEERRLAGKQE